jgi:hypothetical protein
VRPQSFGSKGDILSYDSQATEESEILEVSDALSVSPYILILIPFTAFSPYPVPPDWKCSSRTLQVCKLRAAG